MCRAEECTLDHLNVVRDKADVVLHLETRVTSLFQDQAARATLKDLGLDVGLRSVDGDVSQTERWQGVSDN